MLTINHNEAKGTVTFHFKGRLDTVASGAVSDNINVKIGELKHAGDPVAQKVIFDMKETDYISSTFIRVCVNTAKQVHKGGFSLINCQPFLKKTFKIAGLDETLNVT